MDQLHAEAEQTSWAAPEAIWALVSDATRYPGVGTVERRRLPAPGRHLTTLYPEIVAGLIAAAEKQA